MIWVQNIKNSVWSWSPNCHYQPLIVLQGHEQLLIEQRKEEIMYLEQVQAFFGQHGLGWNGQGGKGQFKSRSRDFMPIRCYNAQNESQNSKKKPQQMIV